FVDSDYPTGEGRKTLKQYYDETLEKVKPDRAPVAKRVSATNQDAFAAIARELGIPPDAPLVVRNFEYPPDAVPAGDEPPGHPHGRCAITQYTLQKDGRVCEVVDFDDATTELVKYWVDKRQERGGRPPKVIILPHHGSRHTDVSPLFQPDWHPESVIVTVNPENQYLHPGAENLLRCALTVGVENIHFTGAGHVTITEQGV